MASNRVLRSLFTEVLLFGCGAGAAAAWAGGFYASLVLAGLLALWLATLTLVRVLPRPPLAVAPARPQTAAEAERGRLRAVLDTAPTPLLALEAGPRLRALNRAARRMFATDDLVRDPLPPLLAPAPGRTLAIAGRTYRLETAETQGLGAMRAVLVLSDVEDELRAAEARATRELLQVLSHEVMNALTPIASLAESALAVLDTEAPASGSLHDLLETLAGRALALQRFTEAYRALARMPEPVLRPTRLSAIIDDLTTMFATRWGKRIALTTDGPPHAVIQLDRDQITQALWALLQNAAEAVAEGAEPALVELSVTLANDRCRFTISDNGPGVPPEHRQDIFRTFFTTKPMGSGIGLSIARHIARAHGGDLTLAFAIEPDRTLFIFETAARSA